MLGQSVWPGATFGGVNAPPAVGPVVISEIQYHPSELPGDDDDYEYVELANLAPTPTPLHTPGWPELPWRLRDAVAFTFPPRITLAAGEKQVGSTLASGSGVALAFFMRSGGSSTVVRIKA